MPSVLVNCWKAQVISFDDDDDDGGGDDDDDAKHRPNHVLLYRFKKRLMHADPPKCDPTATEAVTLSKQQILFASFGLCRSAMHLRMTPHLVRRTTSALQRLPWLLSWSCGNLASRNGATVRLCLPSLATLPQLNIHDRQTSTQLWKKALLVNESNKCMCTCSNIYKICATQRAFYTLNILRFSEEKKSMHDV